MALIAQYPNGFSNGLTVRNLPIGIAYPGKLVWVNNSNNIQGLGVKGSDLTGSGSYTQPYATLQFAVNHANNGDIIVLGMGHAENVSSSTALNINKSVLIYGAGSGSLTPSLTLDTATSATVNISADGVGLCNIRLKANFANIVAALTLSTAKDCCISNVLCMDNANNLNFVNIINTGTVDASADGLTIEDSKRVGLGAQANTCLINLQSNLDRLVIKNCYVSHAATTAAGLMPIATGKKVTNAIIDKNTFNLIGAAGLTTGLLITCNTTSNTGVLSNNLVVNADTTTPILVTASSGLKYFNNLYSDVADTSGVLVPAAQTAP